MKQKISCPCGNILTVDIDDIINLDNNPELLSRILDGTFLNFSCSGCGKKHKPEFPLIVEWPEKKLRMEVLPELDRGEFMRRKKDPPRTETIISYPELSDRLAVIHDGLEPVVTEALKYYLLAHAAQTYPELKISAWYHCSVSSGPEDSRFIEFHLHGIKKDEVAVSSIPWNLYEKNLAEYKRKPRSELFSSLRVRTYLSVNNMIVPEGLR